MSGIKATSAINDNAAVNEPALHGRWRFDERAGDIVADASAGPDLVAVGAPSWTDGPSSGGAIALDGRTQWLSTAKPVVRTDESFSVAAWVRLDSAALNGQLELNPDDDQYAFTAVGQDAESYSPFFLGLRLKKLIAADGTVSWSPRWNFTISPPPPLGGPFDWAHAYGQVPLDASVLDEWTLIVGVFDPAASRARLYVPSTGDQGEIVLAEGWPRWQGDGGLTVGQALYLDNPADLWPGSVGDVRVYSGVLSAEDAARLLAEDTRS